MSMFKKRHVDDEFMYVNLLLKRGEMIKTFVIN